MGRRGGEFWTDERVAMLREMLANGATLSMVASALETTRNAALGKAMRLGIVNRPRVSGWPGAKQQQRVPTPRKLPTSGEKVAPIPMPEPVEGGVATIDLGPRQCRFVLSADAPWLHCAAETEPLTAWCRSHRERVYRKGAA